jgi:hypothetical protein
MAVDKSICDYDDSSLPLVTCWDIVENIPVGELSESYHDVRTCLEGTPFVDMSVMDRNKTSYRLQSYASILQLGIVWVGRQINL